MKKYGQQKKNAWCVCVCVREENPIPIRWANKKIRSQLHVSAVKGNTKTIAQGERKWVVGDTGKQKQDLAKTGETEDADWRFGMALSSPRTLLNARTMVVILPLFFFFFLAVPITSFVHPISVADGPSGHTTESGFSCFRLRRAKHSYVGLAWLLVVVQGARSGVKCHRFFSSPLAVASQFINRVWRTKVCVRDHTERHHFT